MATATLQIGTVTATPLNIPNAEAQRLVQLYIKAHTGANGPPVPDTATQTEKLSWVLRQVFREMRQKANDQAAIDAAEAAKLAQIAANEANDWTQTP